MSEFATYQIEDADSLGRSAAAVLAHLRNWMPYSKVHAEDRWWVFRRLDQIAEAVGISVSTVRRAIALLVERGLLLKKQLRKHNYFRTMFYSVAKAALGAKDPDIQATVRSVQNDTTEVTKVNTSYKRETKHQNSKGKKERKISTKSSTSTDASVLLKHIQTLLHQKEQQAGQGLQLGLPELPNCKEVTEAKGIEWIKVQGVLRAAVKDQMWQSRT